MKASFCTLFGVRLRIAHMLAAAVAAVVVACALAPVTAEAAPNMVDGKAYVASVKWSSATGQKFTNLLHDQAIVMRQDSVYWIGLGSVSESADKKIKKLAYGTSGTVAATETTEDNTRVFMFPVSSLNSSTLITVQLTSGTGAAKLGINTSTIKPLPTNAEWKRLGGYGALGTMSLILEEGFKTSDYAILANKESYWDALSASGLAGLYKCPIVLTDGNQLSSQASTQLKRMKVKNVIIVGGTRAITATVANAVAKMNIKVSRIGGYNAVDTSYKIWQHGKGKWGSDVITATKNGYWDSLSMAPYAYSHKAPVLLHDNYGGGSAWRGSKNQQLLSEAAAGGKRVIIAGGTAVVSPQVDAMFPNSVRLGGYGAYGTSLLVAQWCLKQGMSANNMGIATGQGFWDALVAGPFCGKNNAVLLLADDGHLGNITNFVSKHADDIEHGYAFGGTAVVGARTFEAAQLATANNAKLAI